MTTESDARCEEICRLMRVADHLVVKRQMKEALNNIDFAREIALAEVVAEERDRMRAEMKVDARLADMGIK